MELKDIVSVSGISGLHKIVGHRKNGLIIESLDEKKTRIPTSLHQKVSILEDISMFTNDGDVRFKDVLLSIYDKEKEGLTIPDTKAGEATLKSFFLSVLPEYDQQRVYLSDIKKVASWYNILKSQLDFEALRKDETATEQEQPEAEKKKAAASETTKKTAEPKVTKAKVTAPKNAGSKAKMTATRKTGGA